MKEQWKPINGYESLYAVSNLGRVKSLARSIVAKNGAVKPVYEKVLTPNPLPVSERHPNTHYTVELWKGNNRKRLQIHRLVAEAFVPNPENFPIVNHMDGNSTNNICTNLEWCSFSHNNKHAYDNELKTPSSQKAVRGTNVITGEALTFPSIAEAGRHFGVTHCAIRASAKGYGRAKNACGYKWEYI